MRWGSRRGSVAIALTVTALALVLAAVASASAGGAGATIKLKARYDGRTANGSYIASVFIAAEPQKSGFDIGFRQGSCTDGTHYASDVIPLRGQGFYPTASGRDSFAGYYAKAFTLNRHDKRVNGHERFHVTMVFSGTSVSGVVTDTFTAPTLRCHSGQVHFTAWRDGTAQAPFNTAWGSTGHYAGTSRYGETVTMTSFLPLDLIPKFTITFRAGLSCSGGLELVRPETLSLVNLLLGRNGHFRLYGRDAYTKKGFRYFERWTLSIGPLRTVRWQYLTYSQRGGRTYGTCRTTNGGDVFHLRPPAGHAV